MIATHTFAEITNSDIFDVRDVIRRVEELEDERQTLVDTHEETMIGETVLNGNREAALAIDQWDAENGEELNSASSFLKEIAGYGGDEQWRGEWYPVSFIEDDYFTDYAKELADDIGAIDAKASWPNRHIDWEAAAQDLQQDYSSIDIAGVTFWYR